MSNKLKYAPSPPPEPIIVESLGPKKKKRGRKRTKKQYFTPDTDAAIKEYLDIKVKNDEQLVKMAAIVQRLVVGEQKGSSEFEFGLSDKEKEDLLKNEVEENNSVINNKYKEIETPSQEDGWSLKE